MGVVYLVEGREIPVPVVLKTYQEKTASGAEASFVREANAWVSAGAHRHIVQAFWVREIDDQIFVCAEYVAPDEIGRNSLTHYLAGKAILPEVVLTWASQFCYGMEYALSKGLKAHRDIKPDNLMIDETGTLKITDFGLAKSHPSKVQAKTSGWKRLFKRSASIEVAHTSPGSMMGTLRYMPPEQFINAELADHRADIYAFGIIMYQAESGNRYPYAIASDAADITLEYYRAHSSQIPERIDSPLEKIILRCLEKDPAHRYDSYESFLYDIKKAANALNIALPPYVHIPKEDEEIYAKARSYIALGEEDLALTSINEYVSLYDTNFCGWTEKGKIHFQRNEYKESIDATRRSIALNPYNSHSWNNLGVSLGGLNADPEEAIMAFARALRYDPKNSVAMSNAIKPLVALERFDEAAEYAANALALTPDKSILIHNCEGLLTLLIENREFSIAESLLSSWTAVRPLDINALHNRGIVSLALNDSSDTAIECFERLRELKPDDLFSVEQLAKLYFERQKARACLECCNVLIERQHKVMLAISLKARILNIISGYKAALQFLHPYMRGNPDSDTLLVLSAEIHEYRDNLRAAVRDLKRARSIVRRRSDEGARESLRFIEARLAALAVD